MNELEKLAKPLVDYLRKNHNPHTTIVITDDRVVVTEDIIGIPFPKQHTEIQIDRPIDIIRKAVQKAIDDIAQDLNHQAI